MSRVFRDVDPLLAGVGYYYLTSGVVVLAVYIGALQLHNQRSYQPEQDLLSRFANWDGEVYLRLAEGAYFHRAAERNNLAFFPVFPLLGRCLASATGMPTVLALVIVANVSLIAAFVVLAAYLSAHAPLPSAEVTKWTLLAFGLLPTTFFWRMAYSEALLVLLTLLVLYGVHQRWPLPVLALLVGLATATRPVGMALVPVLALHAWRWRTCRSRHLRLGRAGAVSLLGCWGITAFVLYQWNAFGDPLAFARAQLTWNLRAEADYSSARAVWATATLEPIWAVYAPSRVEYWAHYEPHGNPLLSLQFANPIYFVGTVVLVVVGWRKKWLNEYELLLSAGLLLIPYVTKSYDNAMASFGRFSAVVLPAYIVMGHLLHRMGPALAALVLALMAVMLFVYSAMFAAGYRLI
jgi:hypothetical protein